MGGMAVYRTPPPPAAWAGADIVRIVDPLGLAVAWVVPVLAGACIGFSARRDTTSPWCTVFESNFTGDSGNDATLGLEPLIGTGDGAAFPARLAGASWTMVERDPTSVVVGIPRHPGRPNVTVSCSGGGVEMSLTGDRFVGVRLCIPYADTSSAQDEPTRLKSRLNSAMLITPAADFTLDWTANLALTTCPSPHVSTSCLDIRVEPDQSRPSHMCTQLRLTTDRKP